MDSILSRPIRKREEKEGADFRPFCLWNLYCLVVAKIILLVWLIGMPSIHPHPGTLKGAYDEVA